MPKYKPNAPTCISATIQALKHARRPLTVGEIWAAIEKADAWSPPNGGKSPQATLRAQMKRASEGYAGSRPYATKLFRCDADGRYELLKR